MVRGLTRAQERRLFDLQELIQGGRATDAQHDEFRALHEKLFDAAQKRTPAENAAASHRAAENWKRHNDPRRGIAEYNHQLRSRAASQAFKARRDARIDERTSLRRLPRPSVQRRPQPRRVARRVPSRAPPREPDRPALVRRTRRGAR